MTAKEMFEQLGYERRLIHSDTKKVFNKWIKKTIGQQISAKLTRGNKYYALYCGFNKGEYRA